MISVLLAAYCDKRYLTEEIKSILPQMADDDELLISDDSPSGCTITRDAALAFQDPRIRCLQGPRRGVIRNVEFLLGQAQGSILVLSDQDDVWLPDKLSRTRECLGGVCKPALLLHNAKLTDEALQPTGETLFQQRKAAPGYLRNLLRNSYTGCCMAFTRELLPYVLPFPQGLPMHDQWIGMRAEQVGTVTFEQTPLILHRRHEGAQTNRSGSLRQKILWRFHIASALRRAAKLFTDGETK